MAVDFMSGGSELEAFGRGNFMKINQLLSGTFLTALVLSFTQGVIVAPAVAQQPGQLSTACIGRVAVPKYGYIAFAPVNNCGTCVNVSWTLLRDRKPALFFPGDSINGSQGWQPGTTRYFEWSLEGKPFGSYEWMPTSVKAC